MKSPNLKPGRSLKVSLLATLGVYMALSSSHWSSNPGQADLFSTSPSEIVGLSDDTLLLNGRGKKSSPGAASEIAGVSDDSILTARAQMDQAERSSGSDGSIAGVSEDSILTNRAEMEVAARASNTPSEIASLPEDSSVLATGAAAQTAPTPTDSATVNAFVVEVCEKKFNATREGDNYTFTEIMETECDDCVVTSYRVAVQAETIVQTLSEVAVSTIGDELCPANPELAASSSTSSEEEEEEGEEEEEQALSAWEQCEDSGDDISELQCYAGVLTERRGKNFIEEILADLGDEPTHMQFLNAVKVRLNDVNSLLENLIDTDDEFIAAQIGEISLEISRGLHDIFSDRKFTRLGRNSGASSQLRASQANFINRSIENMVAGYQSWARRGDFRVQELTIQAQTGELSAQAESLRRQIVGMNPDSLQLVRGFMTSYMSTTSNPRYHMDPFYRSQMDTNFHVQLQMLSNMDPSAAALAFQWQTLAGESVALRAQTGTTLQQIIQTESNPAARTAMIQDYNSVLDGISRSVDLTRNDLYDPYFMSFDLLNMRTSAAAGRTADTQFHIQPLAADTVSNLPGNSQYHSGLDTLLNSRTFSTNSAAPTTATTQSVRPGRVSY